MRIHIHVWAVLLLMGWAATSSGEMRTWTSAAGVEVKAQYLGMDAANVLLETEDGTKLSIHQRELSAPDQEWAQQKQAEEEAAEAAKGPRLPVLRGGPGNGRYAFYQCAQFDAYVDTVGRLSVQPKQNGQSLGAPIVFSHVVLYQKVDGEFHIQTVNGYRNVSPPALNPKTLSFVATTDSSETVPFKVEYTFADNKISVVTEIVSSRKPSLPCMVRVNSKFPPSYHIGKTMDLNEIKRAVSGASLTHERKGEAATVQNFYDSIRLGAVVDQVAIKGPWGPLTVYLESDNRRDGNTTRIYNYSGNPLYDGYALLRQVEAGARTGPYSIRIE